LTAQPSGSTFPIPNLLLNTASQTIEVNGAVDLLPGWLSLHPGGGAVYSVLQWTAPQSGIYRVLATFEGFDFVGPTTTDVHILASSSLRRPTTTFLLSGQISSWEEPLSANIPAVQVSTGETISFEVGQGADKNPNFDSTALQAVIQRIK